MTKKVIIGLLINALFHNILISQHCGNDLLFSRIKQSEEFEQNIQTYLTLFNANQRGNIIIPVVFHILWYETEENISDEQIFSQLEILNKDYNAQNEDLIKVPNQFKPFIGNIGIHFCLAIKDSQNEVLTGILRKQTTQAELGISENLFFSSRGGSDAWDSEKYLNIWVANTGKFISGYGTYPNQTISEKTGVVIHPKYFGINKDSKYGLGRVATHEIGHYLGLKHTWGDREGDCDEDDDVLDTPTQLKPYFGCPNYPQYGCSNSEMFMTFMDYVNDQCMYMFSEGQKKRMLATIETTRKGLQNNNSFCINENEEVCLFNIYPNPAFDNLSIRFEKNIENIYTISIINYLGQIIRFEKKFINNVIDIQITDLPKGVYYIKVENQIKRMVKL